MLEMCKEGQIDWETAAGGSAAAVASGLVPQFAKACKSHNFIQIG